jgi:hypothetical protein
VLAEANFLFVVSWPGSSSRQRLTTGPFSFLDPEENRMTQSQLHRALSKATGESVRIIKQRGFSLLEPDIHRLDDEGFDVPPQTVDWDRLEADRMALAIQA